ncbi:MAG: hypothetical protein H5U40_03945 [Polyangiaceae bacterium]|nr:hypothetical protein [Polyangiaceae bacterium]
MEDVTLPTVPESITVLGIPLYLESNRTGESTTWHTTIDGAHLRLLRCHRTNRWKATLSAGDVHPAAQGESAELAIRGLSGSIVGIATKLEGLSLAIGRAIGEVA